MENCRATLVVAQFCSPKSIGSRRDVGTHKGVPLRKTPIMKILNLMELPHRAKSVKLAWDLAWQANTIEASFGRIN